MADGTHAEGEADGERDPRSTMILRCELIDRAGRRSSCVVRNLSRHGMSGRGCTGLRVGQTLTVILPIFGAVSAIVRWANGERFGLQLEEPLDPEALKVEAQPTFEPRFLHRPVTDSRRPGFRVRRTKAPRV